MSSAPVRRLLVAITLLASTAHARQETVPADLGIAPAVHILNGAFSKHAMPQYGLKLSLQGIISREVMRRNQHRVDPRHRKLAARLGEVRIRPLWYLPDTLFVSPKIDGEQLYGLMFRPIGLGLAVGRTPRLGLDASILLTYAYHQSDHIDGGTETHFLRPGVGVTLDIEFPISSSFLISIGWQSQFYIPQVFGGFGVEPAEGRDFLTDTLWHIGQGYLMFHFRFPYTTDV